MRYLFPLKLVTGLLLRRGEILDHLHVRLLLIDGERIQGSKKRRTSFQSEPLGLRKLSDHRNARRGHNDENKIVFPSNVSERGGCRLGIDYMSVRIAKIQTGRYDLLRVVMNRPKMETATPCARWCVGKISEQYT